MKFVLILATCLVAVLAADKNDFRNEFDFLLMQTMEHNMHRGEQMLLALTEQIAHLEESKNKEEKEHIIRELETIIAMIFGSHSVLERELKRTDLNILERFNFESMLKVTQVLAKDLKDAEAKVKAIKV
uniref:Sui m 5.01 allergen n=1 Tax=Suidasia medanensis TaxID=223625 RepID=B2GM86_9ACAR|nr:Sui m 5.01 allergen [Suidasia medanensis]